MQVLEVQRVSVHDDGVLPTLGVRAVEAPGREPATVASSMAHPRHQHEKREAENSHLITRSAADSKTSF